MNNVPDVSFAMPAAEQEQQIMSLYYVKTVGVRYMVGTVAEKNALNMEIPLFYYDKNGQQEKIFTLSGWFHSYTGTGMGFVSFLPCLSYLHC